ncbi:ArsR/SmtB family transcription factor [Proteiniclasticum sp. C24MP]|uniref:ArsR/SmtB family transcription factor n=1 Tax=Proteiniclasticum sp. C24MP TaxID=3374101 RepID=UPI00375472EB
MKFVFHEKESYIFDALQFPGMLYYKEKDILEADDNFIEFMPESSHLILKEMYDLILPYGDRVKKFYFESNENHDFIELLMVRSSFMGKENPLDYLRSLLEKSEEELLFDALYAMDYFDQDSSVQDRKASLEKAEFLVQNPQEIMPWLNELSIGSDAKWQLYSFTQNPAETLASYISLMEEILPEFEKFYKKYKPEITDYGRNFVDRLMKMKGDSLSEVSNGIITENVLTRDPMDVLISMVNSFSIMLNTASEHPFLAWGCDIEKIFIAIREKEANQIQERVTLFKNLGDRTRYDVLMNIAKGITSTKVIAKNLNVSSATISYHLNNLVTAKLIYLSQQEGKYTYKVNHEFIEKRVRDLMEDLSRE